MSIGSIGGQGLPDDQAVINWAGGTLAWRDKAAVVGTQVSPVIDSAGYGFLYCYTKATGTPVLVQVNWSTKADMSDIAGTRTFIWNPAVTNPAEIVYRNLAQYVQVSTVPTTGPGTNWNDDTLVATVNFPVQPLNMADGQSAGNFTNNIPAGGVVLNTLGLMGGGSMSCYTYGGDQGVTVTMQYFDVNQNRVIFAAWSLAAGQRDVRTIGTPFAPIYCELFNRSAASVCNGAVSVFVPYVA